MAQFADTWKLTIDKEFLGLLDKADRKAEKFEDTLDDTKKSADRASTSLKRVGKSAKKASISSEDLTKSFEGVAQGLGISAISGERLANIWLAAGAAAGSLAFAIVALTKKSMQAYIKSSEVATDATKRFAAAQDRLLVTLGDAALGGDQAATSFDNLGGVLDKVTADIAANSNEVRDVVRLTVLSAAGLVKVLSTTTTAALSIPLGAVDVILGALGNFGEGWLELNVLIANSMADLGLISQETAIGIESNARAFQLEIQASTDIENGFVSSLLDGRDALNDYTEGLAFAAIGAGDFSTELQTTDKVLQQIAKATKKATDLAARRPRGKRKKKIGAEEAGFSGFEPDRELTGFQQFDADISAAEKTLGLALGRQTEEFGRKLTNQLEFAAASIGQFTDERIAATAERIAESNLAALGLGEGGAFEKQLETIGALDAAFQDFAEGGINLAIDSMGALAESFAAGTFNAGEFGRSTLVAVGGMLSELGKATIAAALIGDFFQKGGLITSPAAGIGLGIAAVVLGSALAGFGSGGGGRGASGGASRADSAARQTARTLNQGREERDRGDERPLVLVVNSQVLGQVTAQEQARRTRRGSNTTIPTETLRGVR